MSPLAAVLQACIVGGALLGVLFLLGGTAVASYLKARAAEAAYGDDADEDDAGELSVEDDPGAEWDRARDRDADFWRGVA